MSDDIELKPFERMLPLLLSSFSEASPEAKKVGGIGQKRFGGSEGASSTVYQLPKRVMEELKRQWSDFAHLTPQEQEFCVRTLTDRLSAGHQKISKSILKQMINIEQIKKEPREENRQGKLEEFLNAFDHAWGTGQIQFLPLLEELFPYANVKLKNGKNGQDVLVEDFLQLMSRNVTSDKKFQILSFLFNHFHDISNSVVQENVMRRYCELLDKTKSPEFSQQQYEELSNYAMFVAQKNPESAYAKNLRDSFLRSLDDESSGIQSRIDKDTVFPFLQQRFSELTSQQQIVFTRVLLNTFVMPETVDPSKCFHTLEFFCRNLSFLRDSRSSTMIMRQFIWHLGHNKDPRYERLAKELIMDLGKLKDQNPVAQANLIYLFLRMPHF